MGAGIVIPSIRRYEHQVWISRMAVDMIDRPNEVAVLVQDLGSEYEILIMDIRAIMRDGDIDPEVPKGCFRRGNLYYQPGRVGGAVIRGVGAILTKTIPANTSVEIHSRTRGGVVFRVAKGARKRPGNPNTKKHVGTVRNTGPWRG